MRPVQCKTSVSAVFVAGARMERDCIRLYAQMHPEIHTAAVLSGGQELLTQLRSGLNPQVLVIDVLLADMGILSLLEQIRSLHLDPEPVLLLTVPVPERTAARRAVQAFGNCQVMLKPYRMRELFDQVYLLGAGRTSTGCTVRAAFAGNISKRCRQTLPWSVVIIWNKCFCMRWRQNVR